MEMNQSTKSDVSNFRDVVGSEAQAMAERSIRLERDGEIAYLVFDQEGSKANKLSTANMIRIFDLLNEVQEDKSIEALILISAKPSIFIAGADISEIKQLNSGEMSAEGLMKLQSVFNFLENLSVPSICAIHGASMGGGCEIALACDYRIASDAKETKIGLPEVQLGVLPGWGGTQRLPRLVGLEKALDLILTGKTIDGKRAKKMGLVDKVAPPEILKAKATAWAKEILQKKNRKTDPEEYRKNSLLTQVPLAKGIVFDQAKKQVLSKTKGNYPAPLKIISVLKKTFGMPLEKGLKVEAEAFMELVTTPECLNLVDLFFLNDAVKRDKGISGDFKPQPIKSAAVLGAGVMGGGVAQLLAAKGVRVRMRDLNWDAIAKGFQTANGLFSKLVKRRRLKPYAKDNAMALISGTTRYDGFNNLDIVVEAVVENMDVKKQVFEELDSKTGPGTILATNTSSLSVGEMAKAVKDPSRVVGMHFFNPVHKMPLVEVIRAEQTSDEAVASVVAFSKKLGKTPVVVKDAPGFVVNRILTPYILEGVHLLYDGLSPSEVDNIMEKFGMPMGPCELLDEVGIDVGVKVAKICFGAFGDRMKTPDLLDTITDDGNRLGKKNAKGVYLYEEGKKKGEDPELLAKIPSKSRASHLTDQAAQRRMVYIMINEAARIWEEGLVRKVSDIDLAMIFGTGFAPFRGGLLKYADSIGAESIVGDLEIFARNYGNRFQPAPYLQNLAVEKKKFYDM